MRTAPIGPSKGMPEIMRAADAALIASTSWGFSWSAPNTVPTTWTSFRNPLGNEGRSGRSMSRQVKMAWSDARPSRRKNDPGIFPAAYARSSMSTVRGKKSVPSRTERAAVAVASTMVSPSRPTTAPSARWASLPVSNDMVLPVPLIGPDTEMASAMVLPCLGGAPRRFPVVDHLTPAGPGPDRVVVRSRGDRQLAADRGGALSSSPCTTARPSGRAEGLLLLPADAEATDDRPVPLDVVVADVVEEASPTSDELHQPTPGVVVALVHLEVLGEVGDALGEEGDLDLGRSRVGVVEPVLGDRGLFVWHVRKNLGTVSAMMPRPGVGILRAPARCLLRRHAGPAHHLWDRGSPVRRPR